MGGNRFRFGTTYSFLVITESERKMSEICLDNVYNESSLIRIGRLGLEGGGDTDGGCPYLESTLSCLSCVVRLRLLAMKSLAMSA